MFSDACKLVMACVDCARAAKTLSSLLIKDGVTKIGNPAQHS